MGLSRRKFLKTCGLAGGAAGSLLVPGLNSGQMAHARNSASGGNFNLTDLRGSFSASENSLLPGVVDDQSKMLQRMLDIAAEQDKPVFLPPGNYVVANIILPARTRLIGIPGASRLIYAGGGHMLMSENGSHVELQGLVIDGANRGLAAYSEAALRITNCAHLVIDNCEVTGSLETGIRADRCRGRIERSQVRGAGGDCGIMLMESAGMSVVGNTVADCANGGILVHRWKHGDDGTVVMNNRVERIAAQKGGTGQWGNGINVYRAHSVMISNNQVSDCAFSAIRSNAGNNVQITSNTCLRSGECAVYSEFEFEGAMISNNVIDGGTRGISITNFMQGGRMAVCSGNLIRNIHTKAPYDDPDHPFGEGISVEADTTVTGNVIDGAKKFGLMLGWGPYLRNVVATSNVIRGSEVGAYVSVVDGVGDVIITDNVFSGTTNGNVVGYKWKDAATGDLALATTHAYSNLTIARNRTS